MKKSFKSKRGITLVALVVTIIVLIILAGVSISLVLGNNGIVTKAKKAKANTEQAKIEEEIQINEIDNYIEEETARKKSLDEILAEIGLANMTLEEIAQEEEKMKILGNSEEALKLIKESIEHSNIIGNSEYWREIYKNSIPLMTSDTEPRGEATCSPLKYPTNSAYYAFGNDGSGHCTRNRTKFLGSI